MEYLGYHVEFVMNITDIDDKIILRARQQHLLAQFKEGRSHHDEDVMRHTEAAHREYARKNLPRLPADGLADLEDYQSRRNEAYQSILDGGSLTGEGVPGDAEAKVKMHIQIMDRATLVLQAAKGSPSAMETADFFAATSDVLLPYLDGHPDYRIDSSDYAIFSKLTQYWELQFERDLKLLNCMPPTRLTRVTEYMEEIVSFVRKIESKGFAYPTSDGSVYFDIGAFEAAGNSYARLEPWNRNDLSLQADGEGSLAKKNSEKKSDADFALWKASKPGEPSWESPWGRGRPGWHIECSAMASAVLGSQIDIHSGGIDLAFPHHDNELAQSEAYWVQSLEEKGNSKEAELLAPPHEHGLAPDETAADAADVRDSGSRPCCQHTWIRHFLHMGHLSIKGSKMSKSLKNFTTIDEALRQGGGWTARRLRIVFLQGGWREPIEITPDVVKAATAWESPINNFFANVRALVAEEMEAKKAGQVIPQVFQQPERDLRAEFDAARLKFDKALLDSFHTPGAMAVIDDVVAKSNIYVSKQPKSFSLASIKEIARWVTRMVEMFGLDASVSGPDGGGKIGWSSSTGAGQDSDGADQEASESRAEFHRQVSQYRDGVRRIAMTAAGEMKKQLFELSDHLRDHAFVNEGVYLDDRDPSSQPALVKYIPREELITARAQREAELAAQQEKKEAARVEREKVEREKVEQAKLSAQDMFRTSDYSEWDADGVPTKDGEGTEITKSQRKKLMALWTRQKKKHETWLAESKQQVE
ncbi:MAG: hypothetical protein M1826_007306 [Phylliscum demangeonii]|nr:MAG: hypothetical protein M1826_007306 [Phylliscum demangeonii]